MYPSIFIAIDRYVYIAVYVFVCLSISIFLNRAHCVFDSFVLNTTVSAPHDGQITDLRFCPPTADSQTAVLVTTSEEGHFKAWQLIPPAENQGELSHSAASPVVVGVILFLWNKLWLWLHGKVKNVAL